MTSRKKPLQIVRVISVDPDTGEELDSAEDSPMASMFGFMKELMAGNLSANRLNAEVNESLMLELKSMREARAEETKAYLELRKTLEKALSEERERARLDKDAEENSEMKRRAFSEALAMSPVVIGKLLGIPLTGGMPDFVKKFLDTVAPEQIDLESGTIKLEPGQLAALGEIMAEYHKQEEEKSRKARADAGN